MQKSLQKRFTYIHQYKMTMKTKFTWLLVIFLFNNQIGLPVHCFKRHTFQMVKADEMRIGIDAMSYRGDSINIRGKRSTFLQDPCYKNALCKTQEKEDKPICYCDRLCTFFGDCCYDATLDDAVNETILPSHEYFECINYKNQVLFLDGYWMVVKCRDDYNNRFIISQCSNRDGLLNKLPVFDENGITYANIFCAICNGIKNYSMSLASMDSSTCPLNIYFKPSDAMNFDKDSYKGCSKLKFVSPEGYFFRKCLNFKSDISTSPFCRLYQSPYFTTKLGKTHFCDKIDTSKLYYCLNANFSEPPSFHTWFPLTVLLQLSPPKFMDHNENQCVDTKNFNATTGLCFKDTCNQGVRLSNGLCYDKILYNNANHYLHLLFESNKRLEEDDFKRFTFPFYFSLKNKDYNPVNYKFFVYQTNSTTNGTTGKVIITVVFTDKLGLNLEQIENRKNALSTAYHLTYIEKNVDGNNDEATEFIMRPLSENETLSQEFISKKYSYVTNKYGLLYPSEAKPWFKNEHGFCSNATIETTLMNHTQFYSEDNKNGSVFKFPSHFLMVNSMICHDSIRLDNFLTSDLVNGSLSKGDNQYSFPVDIVLTYGCMGLSCVSLAFAIAIHKILLFLKTTPGSNTFNILVNMLLSHFFFMVGIGANDIQIVCKILGIIIHYFWLTTFAFMTIGIFHIAKAFTKISREPNISKATDVKSRWKMTVTGYAISLFIVVISIVVEMVDAIPLKVGYGGQICFPSDYPATVIFVSGPIVLSLVINITCLIVTICAICKQLTSCKLLEKAYFTYLTVYIRLTCLSGFLSISGLLSALFDNDWINITFIVLVGLQGFFISIATTCTKGVFRSLKSLPVSSESTQRIQIVHENLKRHC